MNTRRQGTAETRHAGLSGRDHRHGLRRHPRAEGDRRRAAEAVRAGELAATGQVVGAGGSRGRAVLGALAWLGRRWSRPDLLLAALVTQAVGIALPALIGGVAAALISAFLFGATFLGVSTIALATGAHLRIGFRTTWR